MKIQNSFFEIEKLPADSVESRFEAYVRGKPGVYFNNGRICSSIPYVFNELVDHFNANLGYDAIVTEIIYVDGQEHITGLVNKELK